MLNCTVVVTWHSPESESPQVDYLSFRLKSAEEHRKLMEDLGQIRDKLYGVRNPRNARRVIVEDVDPVEIENAITRYGSMRGVEHLQVFETATEASTHLGYSYNAVAIALARAEKAGEVSTTLRGVTVRYTDTLKV